MPAWEAKFPVLKDLLFGLSGFRHVALSKAKTFYVISRLFWFHAINSTHWSRFKKHSWRKSGMCLPKQFEIFFSDIERLIVLFIEFGNRARAWIRVNTTLLILCDRNVRFPRDFHRKTHRDIQFQKSCIVGVVTNACSAQLSFCRRWPGYCCTVVRLFCLVG